VRTINEWAEYISEWRERKGFETSWANMPEKLLLVITEIAEAAEALRDNPTGSDNFKEELADTAIRLLDIVGTVGINLDEEIDKKMQINEGRPIKHGRQF